MNHATRGQLLGGTLMCVLLTGCGGAAADSAGATSADQPAVAQEDVWLINPVIRNDSTNTVWVSFEDGQTNYQLAPGEQVASSVGAKDSGWLGEDRSLRITRDGGTELLYIYFGDGSDGQGSSNTALIYPDERDEGDWAQMCDRVNMKTTDREPRTGVCDGRRYGWVTLNNDEWQLTLAGDNWK